MNCSKDILFNFVVPSTLVKQLYKSKNKKDNNKLVHVIKSGLSNLKDEIKKYLQMKYKLKKQIKYEKLLKKFLFSIEKIENSRV